MPPYEYSPLPGISCVICSHNGSNRLPSTLAHLAAQDVPSWLRMEVLIVDNASTDGTTEVALDKWPHHSDGTLRVVPEPRLGLTFARTCGLLHARYGLVSFIDDDNWIAPNWCKTAWEVMGSHPHVGACGGLVEPVFESTQPWWFNEFALYFATGQQASAPGPINSLASILWGAGLTVRRSAWGQLHQYGFVPMVADRQGTTLTSGGDDELCHALRLAGWQLYYDPRLQMRHFLPGSRLNWGYLRRLRRGSGVASVSLDPYLSAFRERIGIVVPRYKETWQWQVAVVVRSLINNWRETSRAIRRFAEGDGQVLFQEFRFGRLLGLLRKRHLYPKSFDLVRRALWLGTQARA